jgi:hypothetical protein
MDDKTELLLDYQEMAIFALREEVDRLKLERIELQRELRNFKLRTL